MVFDVLYNPIWTIVIEVEEITKEENVNHWKVGPEEATPHYLQVVAIPETYRILDLGYLEVGVKESEELHSN